MKPEELAAIRYRFSEGEHDDDDFRELLAEVDRLSAENETMREAMTVSTFKARDFCFFCGSPSDGPHVTGCSVA